MDEARSRATISATNGAQSRVRVVMATLPSKRRAIVQVVGLKGLDQEWGVTGCHTCEAARMVDVWAGFSPPDCGPAEAGPYVSSHSSLNNSTGFTRIAARAGHH